MHLALALAMVLSTIAIGGVAVLAVSCIQLWVEFKALQKSTHTLTYIDPLKQSFQKPTEADNQEANAQETLGNITL